MMESKNNFVSILEKANGRKIASVELGFAKYLMIVFEEKNSPKNEDYRLWICDCSWRVESFGSIITGSRDEEDVINNHLASLKGATVEKFILADNLLDITLILSDNLQLRTFADIKEEKTNYWSFFFPKKQVLVNNSKLGRIIVSSEERINYFE